MLVDPNSVAYSNIFDISASRGEFLNTTFISEPIPLLYKGQINTGNALGVYGSSNILFNNCTFKNFKGDDHGGAVNIYDNSFAYFKDNIF